ncbi:hypothetical protein PX699_18700 [Sphingobium sp. H39-3-25]|uniref:hypothetical protein n=1 Tax=Sphingobium arseniciresistens TaxID=3030834 RepID=UPI0023B9B15B|nr:hypothetical protein [Sphingobium arseniciresistens]
MTNHVVVRDADALWALLLTGEIEFFVTNEGFHSDSPRLRIETLGHFSDRRHRARRSSAASGGMP